MQAYYCDISYRGCLIWKTLMKPQVSSETRMGSGKGSPEYWVAVVKPGRVLFEMGGVAEADAKEAMRLAGHKLPIKTKFMTKAQLEAETAVEAKGGEAE